MGFVADAAGTDEQDSAIVRSTFRILVQQTILLGIAMAALHKIFFWRLSDPNWMFSFTVGLLLPPLHPLTSTERSYPVFLASQTAFVLIALVAMSAQSLR